MTQHTRATQHWQHTAMAATREVAQLRIADGTREQQRFGPKHCRHAKLSVLICTCANNRYVCRDVGMRVVRMTYDKESKVEASA
jgi:hypothetical protein